MKALRLFSILTLVLAITAGMTSCKKVNDADLQSAAQTALASNPDASGVIVTVKDQVATLTGMVKDDMTKANVETTVKGVKDIKSVINNLEIVPPAPDFTAIDAALQTAMMDAVKDHKTVTFEVKDGVIILNGEIRKRDLPTLMQKVNALNPPQGVQNNITVK